MTPTDQTRLLEYLRIYKWDTALLRCFEKDAKWTHSRMSVGIGGLIWEYDFATICEHTGHVVVMFNRKNRRYDMTVDGITIQCKIVKDGAMLNTLRNAKTRQYKVSEAALWAVRRDDVSRWYLFPATSVRDEGNPELVRKLVNLDAMSFYESSLGSIREPDVIKCIEQQADLEMHERDRKLRAKRGVPSCDMFAEAD